MYVDPVDGVDEDNDCSKTPCKTLSRVFDNIQRTQCDATIYVCGTNHITEPLEVKKRGFEVGIYSYGPDRPELIFSEDAFLEIEASYAVLEGFNVRVETIHYQELVRFPENGYIQNCIFEDIAFTESMFDVSHFDDSVIRNCSDAYGGGDDSRIFSNDITRISDSVLENNKVQILNLVDRFFDGVTLHNTRIKNTNDDKFDFNIIRISNTTLNLDSETCITGHNLYYGSTVIIMVSSYLSVRSSYIMDNNIFIESGGFDHFVLECFDSKVYIDEDSYIKDNNLVYLGSDELKMGNVDCFGQHDIYQCLISGPGKGNAECPMETWVIILVIIVVLFTCAIFYLCVIICCATCRRCCVYFRKKKFGVEIFQAKKKKITQGEGVINTNFMVINHEGDIHNEVISSTSTPVMYGGDDESEEETKEEEEEEEEVGEEEEKKPLLGGNAGSGLEDGGDDDHHNLDDLRKSDNFIPTIDLTKEDEEEDEEDDDDGGYTYLTGHSSIKKEDLE